LDNLIIFKHGQWNHPDNDPHANNPVGQHNFVVIYPKGYDVISPQNDGVMLIFDPWLTIQPMVYANDEYPFKVDRIGDNIMIYPGE
jgi:hypothetical protein